MKWPRGKYNGWKIVGVEVKFRLDVLCWSSWCLPNRYGQCLGLGPVRIWFSPAYSYTS